MKRRTKLAVSLLLTLLSGCSSTYEQNLEVKEPVVRLFFTPLPVIGFMAVHPWFITHENGWWNRWEVWHTKGLQGERTHVYKNLNNINSNNGWGTPWLAGEWTGKEAKKLLKILKYCRITYPYRKEYWPWPGPNSNTFASWVLEQAGIKIGFPLRAIGSDYR